MVFELLTGKAVKVPDLIARKKYPEALALLQEQLKAAPGETSIRMQIADVLVLQAKIDDATKMLESIADDFATQGFAAKAIAVLKKIQKLDPHRKDLESRIVDLFKTTSGASPAPRIATPPPSAPSNDFGLDDSEAIDLGFDAGEPVPIAVAITDSPASPVAAAVVEEPSAPAAAFAFSAPEAEEEPAPVRKTSPLFDDFSEDEMLEVVRGLELLTYEAGDIIVTEGEKGDSLYVITSGSAKAFIRNRDGGSTQVRQLNEGDFFGEISVLTGKPRTATITSAGTCEMLRLDRATLDSISRTKPRVREVLQQFYEERAHNTAEVMIRGLEASSETCREAGLTEERHEEDVQVAVAVAVAEPEPAADPAQARLQHYRRQAIDQTRKQNWADAVQAWQQYLALRPDDLDAAMALGVLFGKLGRWKEAAQTFEPLVAAHPKDATLLFNLGLSYRQLDQLPQAAASFRQAIALKPDYDKARQGLATVLDRIKKTARG